MSFKKDSKLNQALAYIIFFLFCYTIFNKDPILNTILNDSKSNMILMILNLAIIGLVALI